MNGEGIDLSLIACANELKSPLILVRQLTFELEKTNDIKRREEIYAQIRTVTERSLRLADNLTKAARLEEAMFEFEPVQIVGLCHEVINELKTNKSKIIIRSTQKSPVCVGNRDLLKSLLMGLVDNALQYSGEKDKIYITTRIRNQSIELLVRDEGPLVNLKNFRNLKENLGRHSSPLTARPLTSSLGIALSEKFINTMNGKLSISQHQSGGITFRAILPTSKQMSLLEI